METWAFLFFCSFVRSFVHPFMPFFISFSFSTCSLLPYARWSPYTHTHTMSSDSGSYHYKICCCLHVPFSLYRFRDVYLFGFCSCHGIVSKSISVLRNAVFFASVYVMMFYSVTSCIKITRKNYVRIAFSVSHRYIMIGIFAPHTASSWSR